MGVCLPNTVLSSVKSVIHKREVCNQVAFNSHSTRIPGLVREHRADKANDDIRNSALTKGCVLKTRRIPRTLSALLLVELSIQGFYWIFATLAHAQNKSWCSRTNPDTRVLDNRDIGLTNNSLLQSNDENFVIKLALNYDKWNF